MGESERWPRSGVSHTSTSSGSSVGVLSSRGESGAEKCAQKTCREKLGHLTGAKSIVCAVFSVLVPLEPDLYIHTFTFFAPVSDVLARDGHSAEKMY